MRRVSMLNRPIRPRLSNRRRQQEKENNIEQEDEYMEAVEEQASISESVMPSGGSPLSEVTGSRTEENARSVLRSLKAEIPRLGESTQEICATSCRDYSAKGLPLSEDGLFSMTRSRTHKTVQSQPQQLTLLRRWMNWSMDADSVLAFYWKAIVTVAVIYNCTIIILRTAFTEMRDQAVFDVLDVTSDLIYVVDIVLESKTSFLDNGCLVKDSRQTLQHYKGRQYFLLDVLSVFPAHLLLIQTVFTSWQPIFRFNRLMKCHTMDKFFQRTESRTNNPNLLRAFKLSLHLGLVIHWIACLYYMLSEYEGLGSNDWVYPLEPNVTRFSRKYILCMFWSTMTLTTIGERAPPVSDLEYIFTGFTFLIGVFVFAAVVGNVGDVISNMNAARRDFQSRMDQIKFYMNHRNVPQHLQTRIKRWAEYTWDRTKAMDEPSALQFLPDRLRTEMAIHVHLDVLKKVSIFGECEEGLLRELVLKLKPQIFCPGDYICRIGEIGREMYIINHGQVEILFPDFETGDRIQVVVMQPGNFFGEISLLKLDDGQNRRTADVRSIGFSELLCLSRRDLIVALAEYPEAKKILEDYARQRFNNTKKLSPPETEDSRNVSPRVSCVCTHKKRTARQVFTQVMKREGFSKLLKNVARNRELTEIRTAVQELKAGKHNEAENSILNLQKKIHEMERLVLHKDVELQASQVQIRKLEKIVMTTRHTETESQMTSLRGDSSDLDAQFHTRDVSQVKNLAQHDKLQLHRSSQTGENICCSTPGVENNDHDIGGTLNYCSCLRQNSPGIPDHNNINSNNIFYMCSCKHDITESCKNQIPKKCSVTNQIPEICNVTNQMPDSYSFKNQVSDIGDVTKVSTDPVTPEQHGILDLAWSTNTSNASSAGSRDSAYFLTSLRDQRLANSTGNLSLHVSHKSVQIPDPGYGCRFTDWYTSSGTAAHISMNTLRESELTCMRAPKTCKFGPRSRRSDRKMSSVYKPKRSTTTVCSLLNKQHHTSIDSASRKCTLQNVACNFDCSASNVQNKSRFLSGSSSNYQAGEQHTSTFLWDRHSES